MNPIFQMMLNPLVICVVVEKLGCFNVSARLLLSHKHLNSKNNSMSFSGHPQVSFNLCLLVPLCLIQYEKITFSQYFALLCPCIDVLVVVLDLDG